MKKTTLLMLFITVSFYTYAQNGGDYVANQLIVKFKNAPAAEPAKIEKGFFGVPALDNLNSRYNCSNASRVFSDDERAGKSALPAALQNVFLLTFIEQQDIYSLVKIYRETGFFEYVEPNYLFKADIIRGHGDAGNDYLEKQNIFTPNDTYFSRQWGLYNNGTVSCTNCPPAKSGADIGAKSAWDITTGNPSVIIAVLDMGLKLNHPEVSGRLWVNPGEIPSNGIDDDGNGYKDDVNGWDFENNDKNPTDDQGHGSNVTGIAAATGNNSIGYAGVDWKCKIMTVKVMGPSGGDFSRCAEGVRYAADMGARVINLSFGSNNYSTLLCDAVAYAANSGALVVVASGNNNTNISGSPATCASAMVVGATNFDDSRCNPFPGGSSSSGSNYGNQLSVVAPGGMIYGLDYISNTDYSWWYSGTSQAAPHIAGAAALLLAQDPSLTPAQLRKILETTAEDMVGKPGEDVAGWDKYMGWGRINIYKALQKVTGMRTASENTMYTVEVYPNPFNISCTVKMSGYENLENVIMKIYDIYGHEVKNIAINAPETIVKKNELASGIYFYSIIINNNEKVANGKLIMQ